MPANPDLVDHVIECGQCLMIGDGGIYACDYRVRIVFFLLAILIIRGVDVVP
jgi:hypothetical protein